MKTTHDALQQRIGYRFTNNKLLTQALRHRSCGAEDNERLEFLGDALLGAVVAGELYRRYPDWGEGQLTQARSSLVNQNHLAKIAKEEFALHESIAVGEGEKQNHGQLRSSLLCDALEALIAAIYLDSDFNTAKQCVCTWFAPYLDFSDDDMNFKDAKSLLQEYLQQHTLTLAHYAIVDITGPDHCQLFKVSCHQEDLQLTCYGQAANKQGAEMIAANEMLQTLKDKT